MTLPFVTAHCVDVVGLPQQPLLQGTECHLLVPAWLQNPESVVLKEERPTGVLLMSIIIITVKTWAWHQYLVKQMTKNKVIVILSCSECDNNRPATLDKLLKLCQGKSQ